MRNRPVVCPSLAAAIKGGINVAQIHNRFGAHNITNFVAEAKGVEVLSMEIIW
jgi:hypothetical protein